MLYVRICIHCIGPTVCIYDVVNEQEDLRIGREVCREGAVSHLTFQPLS